MHIWDVTVIVSNDSLNDSEMCIKPYIENPGDSFINAQTVMQMSINGLNIPLRVSSNDGSYFFVEVDYAVAPTNIVIARKDNLHIILKKNGAVLINKTVVIPSDVNVQTPASFDIHQPITLNWSSETNPDILTISSNIIYDSQYQHVLIDLLPSESRQYTYPADTFHSPGDQPYDLLFRIMAGNLEEYGYNFVLVYKEPVIGSALKHNR